MPECNHRVTTVLPPLLPPRNSSDQGCNHCNYQTGRECVPRGGEHGNRDIDRYGYTPSRSGGYSGYAAGQGPVPGGYAWWLRLASEAVTPSEAARAYAEYGWTSVPAAIVAGEKRPMVKWSPKAIPLDAPPLETYDRFRALYDRPGALVAVLTGVRSGGLVVVDIDPGGQRPSLDECPATLEDTSPRGAHLYYAGPRKIRNKAPWRTGVDVRGEGGLVVVPPGPGRAWKLDGPLDPAPVPPILPAYRPPRRRPRPIPAGVAPDRWARTILAWACRKVREAPEGSRNVVLNREAYRAFRDCAGHGMPGDTITSALADAAASAGLVDGAEVHRTIDSARTAAEELV